jgi:hypothetical protein
MESSPLRAPNLQFQSCDNYSSAQRGGKDSASNAEKSFSVFRITWWMIFNSFQLPQGDSTTRGEFFVATKRSQWQRIALLAAGMAASMVSPAWGREPYQTCLD